MSIIDSIFSLELEATRRMAFIILGVIIARRLFRAQISARLIYFVWIAVAVELLIPLSTPVRWSPFNLIRAERGDTPTVIQSQHLGDRPDAHLEDSNAAGTPAARNDAPARFTPLHLGACVWCAGLVVLVAGRILAYRSFAFRIRASSPAKADFLVPSVNESAGEFGIGSLRAVVTDAVGSPALHGIFKPVLLLPRGLLGKISPLELRLVVCHEVSHHRRRDLLTQAVIQMAQAVHWFNPLVWVAGRAAREDCELACDECVIRGLSDTDSRAYGTTLLKVLTLASPSTLTPFGVGIVESKKQIKMRIQKIAGYKPRSLFYSCLGWIFLVAISGLGMTRATLAQQAGTPSLATPEKAREMSVDLSGITEKAPPGWWKNGDQVSSYQIGMDRENSHDGQPSAFVRSKNEQVTGFGGMMQMCQADKFLGKRLCFSAWMKTRDMNGQGAHLWFRVDGKEKDSMLQFDNMAGRQVMGTTEWQKYSVVLDVPPESAALAYGFFINGTGEAWVSGVKIEPVGLEVPSTNMDSNKVHRLPDGPVNLNFSG